VGYNGRLQVDWCRPLLIGKNFESSDFSLVGFLFFLVGFGSFVEFALLRIGIAQLGGGFCGCVVFSLECEVKFVGMNGRRRPRAMSLARWPLCRNWLRQAALPRE
jgi:hypothetical protein